MDQSEGTPVPPTTPADFSQSASPLDDLGSLRIFVKVVEAGSFSKVARRIGVTPATISKHIAGLEARLNQRLLNRTTRHLFVTDAGQKLYEHCLVALAELDSAASELADLQDQPAGHLRVTVPLLLGLHCVSPRLPTFLSAYPKISLDMNFTVEREDLFQERIDVAVRVAETLDPGVVAIKLAPYRRIFCASPEYLARHGTPVRPDDLMQHNCLIARIAGRMSDWPTVHEGRASRVPVRGTFTANHGQVIRQVALAGGGIAMTPVWMVSDDLQAGRLVRLLAEYTPEDKTIYAILLQRTTSSRKLATFVDFLRECFADLNT